MPVSPSTSHWLPAGFDRSVVRAMMATTMMMESTIVAPMFRPVEPVLVPLPMRLAMTSSRLRPAALMMRMSVSEATPNHLAIGSIGTIAKRSAGAEARPSSPASRMSG